MPSGIFDTANVYGDGVSEQMLGKALGDRRGDAVIAIKVYSTQSEEINALGTSRLSIMRELEGSLRRLGTDWIDLYQVHSFDPTPPLGLAPAQGASRAQTRRRVPARGVRPRPGDGIQTLDALRAEDVLELVAVVRLATSGRSGRPPGWQRARA